MPDPDQATATSIDAKLARIRAGDAPTSKLPPVALPAPQHVGPAGRRLWAELTAAYTFTAAELVQVVEVVRQVDRLRALAAVVGREGLMTESPQGQRVHPAEVEARAGRVVLARLIAALRLPDDEGHQPQRRAGVRGAYVGQNRKLR